MYRELLIGCGHTRDKRVVVDGTPDSWQNLTTLDIYPECNPHVVHDLEDVPYPFRPETFDEIHAYEVLEHLGAQGDFKSFFDQFYELWRILKPNGLLVATVPGANSGWLWGDPGHKRVINEESLVFLMQQAYREQAGKTCLTDYRRYWKGDFDVISIMEDPQNKIFGFALKALKG